MPRKSKKMAAADDGERASADVRMPNSSDEANYTNSLTPAAKENRQYTSSGQAMYFSNQRSSFEEQPDTGVDRTTYLSTNNQSNTSFFASTPAGSKHAKYSRRSRQIYRPAPSSSLTNLECLNMIKTQDLCQVCMGKLPSRSSNSRPILRRQYSDSRQPVLKTQPLRPKGIGMKPAPRLDITANRPGVNSSLWRQKEVRKRRPLTKWLNRWEQEG